MALCYLVQAGGTLVSSSVDPSQCSGFVALSAAEYTAFLSNSLNFGWDSDAFNAAVSGGFTLFAVGFGVGLIINQVRKMRSV